MWCTRTCVCCAKRMYVLRKSHRLSAKTAEIDGYRQILHYSCRCFFKGVFQNYVAVTVAVTGTGTGTVSGTVTLSGTVEIFKAQKSLFSDSLLCLGRIFQHPDSNEAWKNRIAGVKAEKSDRDYDGINGEPTEVEWNIFPGFTTLQLCDKINDLLSDLEQTPGTFKGRILFCQCSMTSPVSRTATKMNV